MTAPLPPPSFLMSERFHFLRQAVAAAAALRAAEALGVFGRLAAGPADPGDLARGCRIGERGAQLLLAALASLGLVEAAGDGSYRAVAGILDGLGTFHLYWEGLAEAIRDDRPAVAGDTPAGAAMIYPDCVPHFGTMFGALAERAADQLAAPDLRVLDVGADAAPWSIALAARDSGCRVTAVDLPAVLPATHRSVAAAGRETQFDYLSGDLFTVAWGSAAYDLALAGNICHLFDEAANRRLLARIYKALRPGGTVAIVDALPNERMDGPRAVALYALGLLLRTSSGRVYPLSTYVGWLRDAGYEGVERFDLSSDTRISLITARRPT